MNITPQKVVVLQYYSTKLVLTISNVIDVYLIYRLMFVGSPVYFGNKQIKSCFLWIRKVDKCIVNTNMILI